MFHSAAVKLTLWYLGLIMALSIGCSMAIYHFSANELAHNTSSQVYFFNNQLPFLDIRNFADLREQQLVTSRSHLRNNLILFNFAVLVGGGAASYILARRTLKPIEESHEAQSRFAADASHELRTPLTVMQTEIEVALRNSGLTKMEAVSLLQSNLEEVGKLKTLSEGMLKLASQNGQLELNQIISLKDVATEAASRLNKSAKAKGIKIINDAGAINVLGDKQSLVEAVSILLDNAVRYSLTASQVAITSGKKDGSATLSVADQGQGIIATDLPHVFDRFYRADSSRSNSQTDGYGLGLAIAKKIVKTHGGHIEVKSTLGQGSVFTIHLPITKTS